MQHLETERIAAFDHDAPSVDELAHLAACSVCRTERNAFSALNQRSMHLADAPVFPPAPRLTNWESLSQRLRAEGLIAGEAPAEIAASDSDVESSELRFENVMRALNARPTQAERVRADAGPIEMESWLQRAKPRSNREFFRVAAAAVLLVVSGAAMNQIRTDRMADPAATATDGRFTSSVIPGFENTGFTSVEQATAALAKTEKEFERISTYLTANDPFAARSDLLRKRLAALDRIAATAYEEWQTSPEDRVLDHHFQSALAARELTLKQLGGALPAGRSLERF